MRRDSARREFEMSRENVVAAPLPKLVSKPGDGGLVLRCATEPPPTPDSRQSATLDFHMLKIDVFPHILPRPFFDRLMQVAPSGGGKVKRVQNIPVMIDIDRRFEVMDRHEGYMQVLTLAAPPLENVAGPDLSPDLAKLANDEMAKLVERHPDRFPGFVASLPMNNPEAALG